MHELHDIYQSSLYYISVIPYMLLANCVISCWNQWNSRYTNSLVQNESHFMKTHLQMLHKLKLVFVIHLHVHSIEHASTLLLTRECVYEQIFIGYWWKSSFFDFTSKSARDGGWRWGRGYCVIAGKINWLVLKLCFKKRILSVFCFQLIWT